MPHFAYGVDILGIICEIKCGQNSRDSSIYVYLQKIKNICVDQMFVENSLFYEDNNRWLAGWKCVHCETTNRGPFYEQI